MQTPDYIPDYLLWLEGVTRLRCTSPHAKLIGLIHGEVYTYSHMNSFGDVFLVEFPDDEFGFGHYSFEATEENHD